MTTLHRRTWLLLCLAALGAAGMFLGPDGWLGIDIGPVGSAVLYAAMLLLLIHVSKERDLRIQHSANRAGSGLMAALIVVLISALMTQPDLLLPWLRPLVVANALIGLLMAKTLTENVYAVWRYRREQA